MAPITSMGNFAETPTICVVNLGVNSKIHESHATSLASWCYRRLTTVHWAKSRLWEMAYPVRIVCSADLRNAANTRCTALCITLMVCILG